MEIRASLVRNNFNCFNIVGEYNLHKLVAENPVASSTVYEAIINCLFNVLIGIEFSKNVRKTVPLSTKMGVLGRPVAVYIVTEVQGRQVLHGHSVGWGGLPPWLLQKVAAYPDIVHDHIRPALDSMFRAMFPKNQHVKGN